MGVQPLWPLPKGPTDLQTWKPLHLHKVPLILQLPSDGQWKTHGILVSGILVSEILICLGLTLLFLLNLVPILWLFLGVTIPAWLEVVYLPWRHGTCLALRCLNVGLFLSQTKAPWCRWHCRYCDPTPL